MFRTSGWTAAEKLASEAATEIERLRRRPNFERAANAERDARDQCETELVTAEKIIERLRKLELWFDRYSEPDSPPPYADVVVRLATAEEVIESARAWTTTHLQGTTLEEKIAAYDKEFGDG